MSLIKENIDNQKLRGGYYTPQEITSFLAEWAISKETQHVLEPSCGDGNFIIASIDRFKDLGIDGKKLAGRIKGIELMAEESAKAQSRAREKGLNSNTIINSDFFHYVNSTNAKKYDAILGNPPFIRYQNFPEEHRSIAISLMHKLGFKPNKLTNIWVPFLVISASLLSDRGKLGMVIPAELFQVKYAEETRIFLSKFFQRINIVTFKKLVFKGIQQEIVLILCEKKVNSFSGIRTFECENLGELNKINFKSLNGSQVKSIDHTSEKWTKYFLSENEICFLRKLKKDPRIMSCGDLMEVDVGIVTGRNDFFIMNDTQVRAWGVKKYCEPIVGRSNHLKGLVFSNKDFEINSDSNYPVHLFLPPNENISTLSAKCKKYIKHGESENYHIGYKCRIRKKWYITPSIWTPDAFALRQVADYPKIIINKTNSASTDTIHRVRFKEGVDGELIALSFMNSLTFAFSEITGRSYGGGVMTFEPTEIEDLRIPVCSELNINFNKIDMLVRDKKIEQVLDIVDKELLIKKHNFSEDEVQTLRNIWKKMSNRRLNRSKK